MVCFDTDVISAVLRRGGSPHVQRRLAEVPAEHQCTTAITLAELLYGAVRRRNERLLREIEELVPRRLHVLPFDELAARAYADTRVGLEHAGLPLSESDLRIAAIAISRGLTLATGNVRHFARVPGLDVEDWLAE